MDNAVVGQEANLNPATKVRSMAKYLPTIAILIAYMAIVCLVDPYLVMLLSFIMLLGATPLVLVAVTLVLATYLSGRELGNRLRFLTALAVIVLFLLAAIPLNHACFAWQENVAKDYPEL